MPDCFDCHVTKWGSESCVIAFVNTRHLSTRDCFLSFTGLVWTGLIRKALIYLTRRAVWNERLIETIMPDLRWCMMYTYSTRGGNTLMPTSDRTWCRLCHAIVWWTADLVYFTINNQKAVLWNDRGKTTACSYNRLNLINIFMLNEELEDGRVEHAELFESVEKLSPIRAVHFSEHSDERLRFARESRWHFALLFKEHRHTALCARHGRLCAPFTL